MNWKTAEAQHYRYELNERRRRSVENQRDRGGGEGVDRGREWAMLGGLGNVEVGRRQDAEKRRKVMGNRLTRFEKLVKLKNNLEQNKHLTLMI